MGELGLDLSTLKPRHTGTLELMHKPHIIEVVAPTVFSGPGALNSMKQQADFGPADAGHVLE